MNLGAVPASGGDSLRPGPTGATGREAEAAHLVDLMARVSRAHEDAFAELYDLTSARVYGTVLRGLRSTDHAAEVTQEVFVEVWRQSARYPPGKGSVLAWRTPMAHRRGSTGSVR